MERTHLKIFYDELWAEHILISTGKVIKPFKDRHEFGKAPLSLGFINQKPEEFKRADGKLRTWYPYNVRSVLFNAEYAFVKYLVHLADNRMMMGDYRYGSILRQNLDNYDVVSEFFRRLKIAKETNNIEYIIDAYNMLRIQYFKSKNIQEFKAMCIHHLFHVITVAFNDKWELKSVDDGIHAREK